MNTQLSNTINLEGKLRDSWPEYNLATYDLYQDGKRLDHESQAVFLNGNHVRSFSDRYQVFPNEKAVEMAEKFASKIVDDKLGKLKPFTAEGIGQADKYSNMGLVRDENRSNVYWNQGGTVVFSIFEFEKPYNLSDGHSIYLNEVIGNSINGYCPFSIFSSTFRPYCQNVFMHMVKAKAIESVQGLNLQSGSNQAGDTTGSKLVQQNRKHTKSLTEDLVIQTFESVLTNAFNVIADYERLQNELMTEDLANKIFNNLPSRLTSQLDTIYLDGKDKVKLTGEPTQWDSFNDITNKISFKEYSKSKAGNEFKPKFESVANYMRKTQTIFNIR